MLAWRSAFEFLNLVRCPRLHTTTLVAIRQSGLEAFALSDLSALTSDLRPLTADVRPLTSVLWSCGFESFEPFGHFGFDCIEAY